MGNIDTCQLCLGINTQIYVSGVFRNRVAPPAPAFSIFDNVDNHVPTAVHEKIWAEGYVDLDILIKMSIEDKFARFAVYYRGIEFCKTGGGIR